MIFPRLPIDTRHSTLSNRQSTSALPISSLRRHRLRSGMTLLELVAALALFVIILGSLLLILDAATSLWKESKNQKKEQASAQTVLDLITDDLRHAVTDNDPDPNAEPSFVMESPPSNQVPNQVYVMLRFARYAGSTTGSLTPDGPFLSVEAVFYTLYNSAVYRHVVRLPCTYDYLPDHKPISIGEWLSDAACGSELRKVDLHEKIYARAKLAQAPSASVEPTTPTGCRWTCSLLAENASIDLRAALPQKYTLPASQETYTQVVVDKTSDAREYRKLETRVLPDRLDIAIGIETEESLNQPPQAVGGIEYLSCSQRITFPAQGGSRLP